MSPPRGVGILAMVCRLVGGDLSCRWARRGVYIFESEDRYARGGGFELSVELSRGGDYCEMESMHQERHPLSRASDREAHHPAQSESNLSRFLYNIVYDFSLYSILIRATRNGSELEP